MKKSILLTAAVLLFAILTSKATHIVGGEFSVQWVSGNTYHVKLNHYRDCAGSNADFQTPIPVVIYERGTNAVIDSFCMTLGSRTTLNLGDACYTPSVCVQLGVYETNVTIPNTPNGCYIAYSRCCRNSIITNIQNPGGAGEVWYAELPDPALHNSTPVFGPYPRGYMCAHQNNIQDFSCTDADGDSLVYSLVAPLNGNLNGTRSILSSSCAPQGGLAATYKKIPDAGPYSVIQWQNGYSAANMIGGNPAMSIDPQTGILTANPPNIGVFVFCVRVQQYRRSDKMYLGEVLRDVQYSVLVCSSAAAFPDTTICSGSSAQLHATGGGIYQWSPATGLNSTSSANPVATPSVTTTYTVSIPNGNCSSTATVTVTVNPSVSVSITPNGATTFCQGKSVLLSASGDTKYLWNTGATTSSISVDTSGNYSVKGTSIGCSNTAVQKVTVIPAPKVAIAASGPATFCTGDSITITASGGMTYAWSNGSTNTAIVVKGSQTYYTVGTDASGCTAVSNFISTVVNRPPVATVKANGPTSFCPGGSVQLCASGGTSYLWSPGNSTTTCIDASTPAHYVVTATNANGCKASAGIDVSSKLLSDVTITAGGPVSFCPGDSVILTAHGADTYIWSQGGQTTESITVKSEGSYYVTGTADGCSATSDPVLVSINPFIEVTLTPDGSTSFCEGGSVGLCATSGNSYIWSPGGETTQCITASNPTTYSVTVTNAAGCFGSAAIQTTVHTPPSVSATADGPVTFCTPLSVTITAGGAVSYVWNPDGETTAAITVSKSGTYFAVGTDANGCTATSNPIVVTANDLPSVVVTANGNTTFCMGDSVILTASGADSYIWSPGSRTTTSITAKISATYFVTGTNADGCSATSNSITVKVNPRPVVTITTNGKTTFCQGDSVTLLTHLNDVVILNYRWQPVNVVSFAGFLRVKTGGSYYVVVTSLPGCSDSSNVIDVTVNNPPVVDITASGPTTFCAGDSVTLSASGADTYMWNPGGETTTSITVKESGAFNVTGTSNVGCGSSSSAVTVTVNPNPTVTVDPTNGNCNTGGTGTACAIPGGEDSYSYLWNTSATTSCISTQSTGTFTVTITDENGCKASNSGQVNVNITPPNANAGDDAKIGCGSSTVQLNGSSTTEGATFSWAGGNIVSGANTANPIVDAAGTYTLTVTDPSNGCTATDVVILTLSQAPDCTINGDGSICAAGCGHSGSIQLCVSGGGEGTSYSWSTNATTQCISVSKAGTYTVTVTSVTGCTSTCSKTVVTSPPPSCDITGKSSICDGGSTNLCAPQGQGYTYLWSTKATTQCITVTKAGTYSVTVTTGNGCFSTCSKCVTVSSPPTCSITILTCKSNHTHCSCSLNHTHCASENCKVNHTHCQCGQNHAHCYNTSSSCSSGHSHCSCSVHHTHCSSSNCNQNHSHCKCNQNHSHCYSACSSNSSCNGGTVTLIASGGSSYLWSNGATTAAITVTKSGTYSATVTNSSGCSSTCSKSVTINTPPSCSITGSTKICKGDYSTLCGPSGSGLSYSWSNGAHTQCIKVTCSGTYSLTVTNSGGCSSTCIVNVTMYDAPSCCISGNLSIRKGDCTTLCAPSGCSSYKWNTGETTRCITVKCEGNYCVTVTNSNGCSATCSVCVVYSNSCGRLMGSGDDYDLLNSYGSMDVSAYPNPFNDKATIEFRRTDEASHVRVEVYSLDGGKVTTVFDGDAEAGVIYKAEFDAANLAEGIYIYRIISGNNVFNGKLIQMKH